MLELLKRSSIARRLLLARVLSVWGDTFYAMAAMWVTLELTGSPWRMAMIALAEVLPFLLFSAMAGVMVDRWDRRRALFVLDLTQGAVVAAVPTLYVTGHFSPWLLPAVGFLLATCRTLYSPALTAYYSASVAREDLPVLLGMLSAALRSGSIAVPILLGTLFTHIDLAPAFLVDSLTFLLSALIVRSLPAPQAQAGGGSREPARKRSLGQELCQGFTLLACRRLLLLAMVTCTLGSVMRSPLYRFALPILATGALQAGESGYKLLQFAQGLGGVAGALLANLAVTRGGTYARTTALGWGASALGTMLLGLSPLWLGHQGLVPAMAGLAISGLGASIAYTATAVFMQAEVPAAHIGKVSGLYYTLDMAGDYGGVLLLPFLMTWASAESILAGAGILMTLFCAAMYMRLPRAAAPAFTVPD